MSQAGPETYRSPLTARTGCAPASFLPADRRPPLFMRRSAPARAQIEKADGTEEQREAENVQRLHDGPQPQLVMMDEGMHLGAAHPHLPGLHIHDTPSLTL